MSVSASSRVTFALIAAALLLSLGALVTGALAQAPFAPQAIPQVPVEGRTFTLRLMRLNCDVFLSTAASDRVVALTEDQITVTVKYVPPVNGSGCVPGTIPIDWTVGPFPAGDYTLTVLGHSPFDVGIFQLTSFQVTIQPASGVGVARTIPTLGTSGLLPLMLIVVLAGFLGLRRLD